LADRSLESGSCNEDSSDGEPDLSSDVLGLGLGFFYFLKGVWSTMTKYNPSQFHPRSLRCVLSLDSKQAQAICVLYSLPGKTKVEQHLAIVDHFFETPTLKSEKNQKAQNDNEDKLNTLLERVQKKTEAQIA